MAGNYGDLYNIGGWGDPYFVVNKEGHLCVRPTGQGKQIIDVDSVIMKATKNTKSKGQFPMILRFPDVLKHRLDSLHAAFKGAIEGWGYQSSYQGVFPVKVNQNKAIVQDLVRFGMDKRFGLEAGSKPELLIAMSCLTALTQGKEEAKAYLVCNGYKDADYIALALSARAMNLNAIIVLEMEEELDIVLHQSQKLGVEPVLGVRAKLLTKIPGHFGSTAGKHGKFGMLADKIYKVAERLKEKGKLDWLQLLHFHIGSMIPTTEIVGHAAKEAAEIYCNLVNKHGATKMTTLDCGGGLGVNYDGTKSGNSDMSVAYGLPEYASSIVRAVRDKCNEECVPHPVLCTESGRALVSHHSMIILEALSAIEEPQDEDTREELLNRIQDLSSKLLTPPPPEAAAAAGADMMISWHAEHIIRHAIEVFKMGKKLSKRVTSDAATIYNYHMNLSIFSLIPDFWGIKQLFPMMPVSRLNEEPTCMATLVDITCDSDGMVAKFIGGGETLPLHPLDTDRSAGGGGYYVAVLLSGAYQEALAGKHNLFSGPTLVRVVAVHDPDDLGAFNIESVDLGTTSKEVISTMRYDVDNDIAQVIRELAEQNHRWEMVEPLLTEALTTMPYLNQYNNGSGSGSPRTT